MADKVHATFHMKINEGSLEEFKGLAEEISDVVKGSEPGTEVYDWHFSEDGSYSICHELYSDEAAMLAHLTGEAPGLLGKFMEIGAIAGFFIMSDVKSPELRTMIGKLGGSVLPQEAGFRR